MFTAFVWLHDYFSVLLQSREAQLQLRLDYVIVQ